MVDEGGDFFPGGGVGFLFPSARGRGNEGMEKKKMGKGADVAWMPVSRCIARATFVGDTECTIVTRSMNTGLRTTDYGPRHCI